ncbi:hypothetical protein DV737_g1043, partial [Chaetothyriales sp. CBS 132003]
MDGEVEIDPPPQPLQPPQAPRLQQPNFPLLTQSMQLVTEQVSKLENIPAVDSGNRLSAGITNLSNTLNASIDNLSNTLNARIDNLNNTVNNLANTVNNLANTVDNLANTTNTRFVNIEARLDGLKTQITAIDFNSVARLQNSQLRLESELLSPLKGPASNEPIANFPQTSSDIRRMNTGLLDSVLRGLGLPTAGNVEEKRKRLRAHIGILTTI